MKTNITSLMPARLFLSIPAVLVAILFGTTPNESLARFSIIEFAEAELFLEENTTDGDLGIHFKVDGEPWDRIMLFDRFWRRLVDLRVRGSSGVIGLTELFNESAEPSFDELPREEFLALFPEGFYYFFGRTIEGDWLFAVAELEHEMVPPSVIISPAAGSEVDPTEPLLIEWELAESEVEVAGIEVVLEGTDDEVDARMLTAEVLAEDTSLIVPAGFLTPGTTYKVEILVEAENGNKTISESEEELTTTDT